MKNTIYYRFFVGIDLSKLTLDVCLVDWQTQQIYEAQFPNDPQGFKELDSWLTSHGAIAGQTILCSEHTGRYGERFAGWTSESQWDHAIVKTTALKKVKPEHHKKNDAFDAALLAEYARRYTDKLSLHQGQSVPVKQLNRLRRERRYLVDERARIKQKLGEVDYHDTDMSQFKEFYRQQIALLSKQIKWMEQQITKVIKDNDALRTLYNRLKTAPGFGEVVTSFWLSTFADHEKLDPRKISSRFGFAPYEYRSGTTVQKKNRSSGFGNGEMRRIMHQAARSVAHHKPHFREYYQRKLQEGKPERLILNNIINKIIRTACTMWNNQTDYDPLYIQKRKKNHILA